MRVLAGLIALLPTLGTAQESFDPCMVGGIDICEEVPSVPTGGGDLHPTLTDRLREMSTTVAAPGG
ncbi:hypothetical protein DXV76_02625 [Rhodobacteraceae bacterium CCMM004]|nr:hypothetical protein DXV76_02625 [Rhodobacteraceae bacterium CCMM004]